MLRLNVFSVRLISRYAFDWVEQLRYCRNELFDTFKEGLFEYIHLVSNITNYYIISGIDQMISSGLERFTIILQLKIYITCFVIIPYCYQSDKPFVSSWNRREAAPLYDMILYTNTNINHGLSNNKPPISHMLKEIIAINLIILSQVVEIEYNHFVIYAFNFSQIFSALLSFSRMIRDILCILWATFLQRNKRKL